MIKIADITSPFRSNLILQTYKQWVPKSRKLLDIGCGTGVVADTLASGLKANLTGCDIDNYLIRKIPFKKMYSFSHLPFDSKQFDFSMLNDVLHHTVYENQIKLIKEAIRVGGTCLIFELKPDNISKILDFAINKIHNPRMPIPFTYRTRKSWQKLFKDNNLVYKCTKVKSPIYYPFSHIAFRVSKKKIK